VIKPEPKKSSMLCFQVPHVPDSLVVNLGDALEALSGGLLLATPHRVSPQRQHTAASGRLSFPFFFDPNFNAQMTSLGALSLLF